MGGDLIIISPAKNFQLKKIHRGKNLVSKNF